MESGTIIYSFLRCPTYYFCNSEASRQNYEDNLKWIKEAHKNKLVVGSQARILYTDMRVSI